MITNNSITLWHKGTLTHIAKVFVKISEGMDKNGIKQNGFFEAKTCIVRIPKTEDIEISAGDYIRIGEYSGDYDRNSDFKVMSVSYNFYGLNPHYKVVCKR